MHAVVKLNYIIKRGPWHDKLNHLSYILQCDTYLSD